MTSPLQYPGTITVKLYQGRNIPAMQSDGFADPYVRLKVGKNELKSKIVKHSLNPIFNEQFNFVFKPNDGHIHVILCQNRMVSDDVIGEIFVDPSPFANCEKRQWFKPVTRCGKDPGEIEMGILFNCPQYTEHPSSAPAIPGPSIPGPPVPQPQTQPQVQQQAPVPVPQQPQPQPQFLQQAPVSVPQPQPMLQMVNQPVPLQPPSYVVQPQHTPYQPQVGSLMQPQPMMPQSGGLMQPQPMMHPPQMMQPLGMQAMLGMQPQPMMHASMMTPMGGVPVSPMGGGGIPVSGGVGLDTCVGGIPVGDVGGIPVSGGFDFSVGQPQQQGINITIGQGGSITLGLGGNPGNFAGNSNFGQYGY